MPTAFTIVHADATEVGMAAVADGETIGRASRLSVKPSSICAIKALSNKMIPERAKLLIEKQFVLFCCECFAETANRIDRKSFDRE